MNLQLSTPFSWAICIVSLSVATGLNLAATDALFGPFPVEWMIVGMIACATYAFISTRQAYVYARKWPKTLIVVLFPLSFLHLIFDAPIALNVGITVFNLLLWGVGYRLTRKLIRLSPKNTLNLS